MSDTGRDPGTGDGWFLGIDFGTVATVAVLAAPDGRLLPLVPDGDVPLPSAVFVTAAGALLAGPSAQAAAEAKPGRFVTGVKDAYEHDEPRFGELRVPVAGATAAILREVRAAAVRRAGTEPAAVAIGYRASWSRRQRLILAHAAELAGWPDAVLVPEPVCVAEYVARAGAPVFPGQTVAVYDFGAGHLDVSLVHRDAGGFTVTARTGSPLGGQKLDETLRDLLARRRPGAGRVGPEVARAARERLSAEDATAVPLGATGPDEVVTRQEFESAVTADVRSTAELAADLIDREADAGTFAGLHLTGGVSRMPLVANLYRAFRRIPATVDRPESAVAAGAALHVRPPHAPAPDLTALPVAPPPVAAVPTVRGSVAPARSGERTPSRLTPVVAGIAVLGVLAALVAAAPAALRPRDPGIPAAGPAVTAPPPVTTPVTTPVPAPPPASTTPAPSASAARTTAPPVTRVRTSVPSRRPATTTPTSPPPFRVPAVVRLVSAAGLCATPDQPRDRDAIPVRLQPCTDDAAQRWDSRALDDRFVLVNVATGKCLDLNTAPETGGGLVQQWLCRDNDHQRWRITRATGDTATLSVKVTGECLAVAPGQDRAGGLVHKGACAPAAAQRWRLAR
jgi:hypothetical protein